VSRELDLEREALRLEGDAIERVRYQRGRALDEVRAGAELHEVEHRVVLDLRSGRRVAIGYGNELATRHGYGVTLAELRVVDPAYGAVDDVGATPRWASVLARPIDSARIVWDDVRERLRSGLAIGVAIHADYLTRQDFPSALELGFGSTRVLVAAARLAADRTLVGYANALVVRFPSEP